MNQEEFLQILQDSLRDKVPQQLVNENISYYRNYIKNEKIKGKTETEILNMLGDPRLLARTIQNSNNFVSDTESHDGDFDKRMYDDYNASGNKHKFKLKNRLELSGWLITAIVLLVIFVIFMLVFKLIKLFLPFVLIMMAAGFVYRLIKGIIR